MITKDFVHGSHYDDRILINKAFIPKKLFNDLLIIDDGNYNVSSDSLFRSQIKNKKVKIFMFNDKTGQLLLDNEFSYTNAYEKYAIDVKRNYTEDFIIGEMFLNSVSENGRLHFSLNRIEDMKNKNKSNLIVHTLEMFLLNGANNKTLLSFGNNEKEYELKYFLKTKVLW